MMAVASWMLRGRFMSHGRSFRSRSEADEDSIQLDVTKDVNENIYEVLSILCQRNGTLSGSKKLLYLNQFIKVLEKMHSEKPDLRFKKEDVLYCLRVGLVHEDITVRAGTLRVVRHFINDVSDIILLNKLNIPFLVTRSMEIIMKNDTERIEAFRLCQRIMKISAKHFPKCLAKCIVSLANNDSSVKDRMMTVNLTLLCQLCVMNPNLIIECDGHVALLRSSVEVGLARVNECIMGCLLFLLNDRVTRRKAKISLSYLNSVYCDLSSNGKVSGKDDKFHASLLSIMAALRSFSGVVCLCQPDNDSAMKNIIEMLSVNDNNLRRGVIVLLYEIFGLNYENWNDDVYSMIERIDPSKYRNNWKLSSGFVTAEGRAMLPNIIRHRCNLREVHTAFIIYCLLECNLLSGLMHVVVCDKSDLALAATVFLGFILQLAHQLLAPELIDVTPALPKLFEYIADSEPMQQQKALQAVWILNRIHEIYKRGPIIHSLYLKHILEDGTMTDVHSKMKNTIQLKDLEYSLIQSKVLINKDPKFWNWQYIAALLKGSLDSGKKLEDSNYKNFIKKLIEFYKPSNKHFGTINVTKERKEEIYVFCALSLFDMLVTTDEGEIMLLDLVSEICGELDLNSKDHIEGKTNYIDQQTLENSLTQYYILMLGHLTRSNRGVKLLTKNKVVEIFLEAMMSSYLPLINQSKIKLILSSMSYSNCQIARVILSRALTSPCETTRIFATELLLIFARVNILSFVRWGVDMLVTQFYDESSQVTTLALDIAYELCYDPAMLMALINCKPSLLHLGDKGHRLLVKFLSTNSGFAFLNDANFIESELEKWDNHYNYRYVGLIEDDIHDGFTLHRRGDDNKFMKRLTNVKQKWKDVFIVPHLYGELAQHEKGLSLIIAHDHVYKMIQFIINASINTKSEVLELKSSLWAVSHVATSEAGIQLLEKQNVFPAIIELANSSRLLSIQATSFYCLNLISSVPAAAAILAKYGWYTTRHDRSSIWPTITRVPLSLITESEYLSGSSTRWEEKLVKDLTCPNKSTTLPPGLIPGRPSHRRCQSESHEFRRRTLSDSCESPPELHGQSMTYQDVLGIAKLQSLNIHRRPEVAGWIPELQNIDFMRKYSLNSERNSSGLVCEFEAKYPPRLFSKDSQASLWSNIQLPNPQAQVDVSDSDYYIGICLPKQLAHFLSFNDSSAEDFVETELEEESGSVNSSTDSSSEDNVPNRKHKSRRDHDIMQCLLCCSKNRNKRQRKSSNNTYRLRTETESSQGNNEASPISLNWRLRTQSESVFGSDETALSEMEPAPRITSVVDNNRARREVIKHIYRMCNPVWSKPSRQSLLNLKQSHPTVFQDICLYSDVCRILSNVTCRINSRRVIQELFLDTSFEQLYDEVDNVLKQYEPVKLSSPVTLENKIPAGNEELVTV